MASAVGAASAAARCLDDGVGDSAASTASAVSGAAVSTAAGSARRRPRSRRPRRLGRDGSARRRRRRRASVSTVGRRRARLDASSTVADPARRPVPARRGDGAVGRWRRDRLGPVGLARRWPAGRPGRPATRRRRLDAELLGDLGHEAGEALHRGPQLVGRRVGDARRHHGGVHRRVGERLEHRHPAVAGRVGGEGRRGWPGRGGRPAPGGNRTPALGGRDDSRRARTTRPTPRAASMSASQSWCSLSWRLDRPSFRRAAISRVDSSRATAGSSDATTTERRSRRSSSSRSFSAPSARSSHSATRRRGSRSSASAHDAGRRHLGLALGAELRVLLLERLAHGGHAALQHLLGHRLLLGRQRSARMALRWLRTGAQPLGLGPHRQLGHGRPRRALGARRTITRLAAGPVGRAVGTGRTVGRRCRGAAAARSVARSARSVADEPDRDRHQDPGRRPDRDHPRGAGGPRPDRPRGAAGRAWRRASGSRARTTSCRRAARCARAPCGRPWARSTEMMVMPSTSKSASARSTSPTLAPPGSRLPSSTPRGSRAPAARHVQVPSWRALVSSSSILRDMAGNGTRDGYRPTTPPRRSSGVRYRRRCADLRPRRRGAAHRSHRLRPPRRGA